MTGSLARRDWVAETYPDAVSPFAVQRNGRRMDPDVQMPRGWWASLRRWKYRRYFTFDGVQTVTIGALIEVLLKDETTITGRMVACGADSRAVLMTGRPGEPPVILEWRDVRGVHVLFPGHDSSSFPKAKRAAHA